MLGIGVKDLKDDSGLETDEDLLILPGMKRRLYIDYSELDLDLEGSGTGAEDETASLMLLSQQSSVEGGGGGQDKSKVSG